MILMKEFKEKYSGLKFDIQFKDRLTLICGESGEGKTVMFNAIRAYTLVNHMNNVVCINYNDSNRDWRSDLQGSVGKIIVIDNADSLLTNNDRLAISMDKDNQYIIFTNSTRGFKPAYDSLAEYKVKNNVAKLDYYMSMGVV